MDELVDGGGDGLLELCSAVGGAAWAMREMMLSPKVACGLKAVAAPEELLVRVDSGHDSGEFIAELIRLNVRFLVRRSPRRESPGQLLDSVRGMDPPVCPRPGKAIHRGVRADRSPAGCDGHRILMVIEGVERTVTRSGQRLPLPEVEVSGWWTNLPLKAAEYVGLHHAHGTGEQFHSELRSDMGVEQLPSGRGATNALMLGLSAIAFNCMRDIGQRALTLAEEAREAAEEGKAEEEGKDREPPDVSGSGRFCWTTSRLAASLSGMRGRSC